ncbi:MAG: DUF4321 domain-containing protein [Candidatus Rokubacteria bacterium]|nr:DUF4321 domain-containing protein [Candidatus Rokubacteria bacterium]MBI3827585.1 DUF4321 domain-containing protein [Candidatus Rokubacteria bacterium]
MPARGLGVVALIIIAGLIIGSLLGELLGHLIPWQWAQDLLTRGPSIGFASPITLDLKLLTLSFGFTFKVNLVGVLGILIAAFTLRRM